MYDTALEAAFVQQLELEADAVGQGTLAASHDDRNEEEVVLVDQARPDRLGGEDGTAHGDIPVRPGLHLPDRSGVEVPLQPRPGGGYRLQRTGVHDLVGRLPDPGEVV